MRWLLLLLLTTTVWAQEALPFKYLAGHFLCVNVTLADKRPSTFIFDTGIGVNLLSNALAGELGSPVTGQKFTGKRMSGQSVDVPLTWVSSLSLGKQRQAFVTCGTWEFDEAFLPAKDFPGIEGFVGLRFFQHLPVTVDYRHSQLIFETPESLEARVRQGVVVPVHLDDDQGVSLTPFVDMQVDGIGTARVEIDTGSHSTELHTRYMEPMGIRDARTREGTDETHNRYTRYFAESTRAIRLGSLVREKLPLMFQDIIYDGVIGNDFLRAYTVTWDLSRSRIILASP